MARGTALRDGGNGGESAREPIDRILEVLNHPVRREILTFLANTSSETLTLDDVVDQLAAERDASESASERRRLELHLQHVYLPKLAQENLIEYDPANDALRYRPDEDVEAWLERIQEWETK